MWTSYRSVSILCTLLLLASGCGPPADERGPAVQAPSVTLTDLRGAERSLEEFRGQIVLLNFWATWCPPCLEEIPDLIALHNEWQENGVVVVGVAMDVGGPQIVQPFVDRQAMTYPVLLGTSDVAQQYRVIGLPTSFLLDREGAVIQRFDGPYTQRVFTQAIRALINEEDQ